MSEEKRTDQARSTHLLNGMRILNGADYRKKTEKFIFNMLIDDIGNGDITTDLFSANSDKKIAAEIISNGEYVMSGLDELVRFFNVKRALFKDIISFECKTRDGERVKKNTVAVILHGYAKDILKAERTILNFIQRLSGIATMTARFVKSAPPGVLITPTRKTFWGAVDKRACITGGGGAHRINLSDAVLIKDNHLSLFGGDFERLLDLCRAKKTKARFIEIEVDSPADAKKLITVYRDQKVSGRITWPLYILLDNFTVPKIKQTVKYAKNSGIYEYLLLEASGGINLKNIGAYSRSGVDIVSVGALTHSAPAADFSLSFIKSSRRNQV